MVTHCQLFGGPLTLIVAIEEQAGVWQLTSITGAGGYILKPVLRPGTPEFIVWHRGPLRTVMARLQPHVEKAAEKFEQTDPGGAHGSPKSSHGQSSPDVDCFTRLQ